MASKRQFKLSSVLLFGASVMLAVWAIASWLQQGKFDAARRNVFERDPHADVTVFWVGLMYSAGPFFSSLFAIAYAFLGILLLRRPYEWLPFIAVLLSLPAAAVCVLAYTFSGR